MANSLIALLQSLNAQIRALSNSGLKIYDDNDPDWYLNEVAYDSNTDKLIFICKDDFKTLEVVNK